MIRFIDDLTAINNGGEFERSFEEIYPPELILEKENLTNNWGSFWIYFFSNNRQFSIQLYDKRNGFPFSIVLVPYLRSNIPFKIFYSTFGCDILRTVRITNSRLIFVNNSKS